VARDSTFSNQHLGPNGGGVRNFYVLFTHALSNRRGIGRINLIGW